MEERILASIVLAYIDFGESHGLRREDVLAAAQLSPAELEDPDGLVSVFALMLLWRFLITELPEVIIPLAAADWVAARIGLLGHLLRTAVTLREALGIYERFRRLTDNATQVVVVEHAPHIALCFRHTPEVHALGLPLELFTALTLRLLTEAYGGSVPLVRVTFSHSPFYPVDPYRQYFGVPVEFDQAECALWLPRDILDRPTLRGAPELRRYLEAHAQRMLDEAAAPVDDFVARVRHAIAAGLATGKADQSHVARQIAVSVRTLQRRLTESGTSFQELLETVRHSVAERLLRDPKEQILDVALALGYADTAAFHRAFKRWTGQTPHDWRRRGRGR